MNTEQTERYTKEADMSADLLARARGLPEKTERLPRKIKGVSKQEKERLPRKIKGVSKTG